jgi:hypothetical protein
MGSVPAKSQNDFDRLDPAGLDPPMARPLRFQYPGAVYHVMARGDGGKKIFESADDHAVFLSRLGEACESHGWRVHAWVLMGTGNAVPNF